MAEVRTDTAARSWWCAELWYMVYTVTPSAVGHWQLPLSKKVTQSTARALCQQMVRAVGQGSDIGQKFW